MNYYYKWNNWCRCVSQRWFTRNLSHAKKQYLRCLWKITHLHSSHNSWCGAGTVWQVRDWQLAVIQTKDQELKYKIIQEKKPQRLLAKVKVLELPTQIERNGRWQNVKVSQAKLADWQELWHELIVCPLSVHRLFHLFFLIWTTFIRARALTSRRLAKAPLVPQRVWCGYNKWVNACSHQSLRCCTVKCIISHNRSLIAMLTVTMTVSCSRSRRH